MIPDVLFRRLVSRAVFVVGPARSGTTVLVNALAEHPAIAGGFGEAPLVARLGELAGAHLTGEKVEYYNRSLRMPWRDLLARFRWLAFESALGGTGSRRLLRRLLTGGGLLRKRAWCAKTFPSEESAVGLRAMFPGVRFVLAFRNGCDVVHSQTRFHAFAAKDFEAQCATWAETVEKFLHLEEAEDSMTVRQEDVAADPAEVFARVLPFLGLPASDRCARYCRTTLVHPLDEKTKKGVDASQQLRLRRPGHEAWTEDRRKTFRRVCGATMERLGYPVPF